MPHTTERPDPLTPAIQRKEIFPALQLLFRLCQQQQRPVILQIAGVSGGEGASSFADAFATIAHAEARVGVLVVTFDDTSPAEPVKLRPPRPQGKAAAEMGVVRARMNSAMLRSAIAGKMDIGLSDLPPEIAVVILDTEPLLACAEASAIGPQVDGVILVISDATRATAARKAIEAIELAGGRPLGIVMNRRRYRAPRWLARMLDLSVPLLRRKSDLDSLPAGRDIVPLPEAKPRPAPDKTAARGR